MVIKHDAFEHLRLSLFSSNGALFAMLTAYFDESNTAPNQRVPMVAGYLASTLQWSRFSEQWTTLLRRYDVPKDKDGERIAHRNKIQHRKGLFCGWSEPHRDEFLSKAGVLIRRHTKMPIGNAVFRKEFEQIVPQSIQKHFGGPYGWCVYSSLFTVKDWCERHSYTKPIRYVFEAGAEGQWQVNEMIDRMYRHGPSRALFRIGGHAFESKKTKPLQAADFLAYDLGRYALDFQRKN